MEPPRQPATTAVPRAPLGAVVAALVAFVLLRVSPLTFVDVDLWHQMALARESLRRGAVPITDPFAYTPTLPHFVQHEWGAGVIFYAVARAVGPGGFLAFKYALVAAVVLLALRAARRAGASAVALALCALPAAQAAHYGFTTIRAGLLTMACLAAALNALDAARRDRRAALALVPLFALWTNVHAGFVVGLGLVGLDALERALRRERFAHLAAALAACAALVLATPYGLLYPRYLAHALFMPRPDIVEWAPLWKSLRPNDLGAWAAMVGLGAYAVRARGIRACEGAPAVGLFALAAFQHHRHLTLLAVLWFARVPAWLAGTDLERGAAELLRRRASLITPLLALVAAVWIGAAALLRPWSLVVPTSPQYRREGVPTYPAGACDYLRAQGFRGNVMTPFQEGAYVMWRLAPQSARVSNDSRFETAYPTSVARVHGAFYGGAPGWPAALRMYPTDVVLVPRDARVLPGMLALPGWRVVYGDDLYMLFAREGSPLPFVDRRGAAITASFP